MNSWKIATIVTIAVLGAAIVCASAIAFIINAQTPSSATNSNYPNGMMGDNGNYPNTNTPTTPTTPSTSTTPIDINQAVTIAQNYVASTGNPNLAVREVEEYTQNYYVQIYEKDTGNGAFEMLIDRYTGSIYPEQGPNMMWNTKYGMMSNGVMGFITGTNGYTGYNGYGYGGMGGMMGGYGGYYGGTATAPTTAMPVTVDQATANAQQYLNAYYPGTTVGDIDTFYGYYHVDVLLNGVTYGMLSVNGYTGQVWYHTWHGAFIQAVELS